MMLKTHFYGRKLIWEAEFFRTSQFGIVVQRRFLLLHSVPHWACIRLFPPQAAANSGPRRRTSRRLRMIDEGAAAPSCYPKVF